RRGRPWQPPFPQDWRNCRGLFFLGFMISTVCTVLEWPVIPRAAPNRAAVMFERFTQKGLNTIFSAHQNAIWLGSAQIEPEHLLLGLLHESTLGDASWTLLVPFKDWLSNQICARAPMKTQSSFSVETPFSREAKRVLESAIEEAKRL